MKIKYFIIACLFILLGCNSEKSEKSEDSEKTEESTKKQRPIAIDNGKFFEQGGKQMLYGGESDMQHFDVSNSELKAGQFHYGIGREKFPALLAPKFTTIAAADSLWNDEDRFLIAYKGDDVKAYSVKDLTRHEVVNDMLDGEPIMAAYCVLADLGAIYERTYGDEVLTFALSGYTYYDPEVWDGLDGFVFWDRETESLWWPLIGRSVSGLLKGVGLLEMDKVHWKDTNWGDVKHEYPNAQVLISGQDYARPDTWPKLDDVTQIRSGFLQSGLE